MKKILFSIFTLLCISSYSQINIENKTGNETRTRVVDAALIELKIKSADIEVSWMSVSAVESYKGKHSLGSYIVYRDNKFYVFLDKSVKISRQKLNICHELIHLKQYLTGRLAVGDVNSVLWNNKFVDISQTSYHSRPWEKEAFKLQVELYNTIKSL